VNFIGEAEIDVVPEPGFVRIVVSQRVERCHDVLPASIAVLGCFRQPGKVDQQVLRPILNTFPRCRRACMLADPPVNVIGKPLVELSEVSRDDESIMTDVMSIPDRERIGRTAFFAHRNI
jgi:hypothetical protein